MKKILIACTLSLFIFACNNAADDKDTPKTDSMNMNTDNNTDNRADQVPVDNTPSKDTSSYERMSTRDTTQR